MKLAKHLEEIGKTPRSWAKEKGLPKDGVYRHLNGKRVDYDTAKRMSEATSGAVAVSEIME